MQKHFLDKAHFLYRLFTAKYDLPRKLLTFQHFAWKVNLPLSTLRNLLLFLPPIWAVQVNIACLIVSHS